MAARPERAIAERDAVRRLLQRVGFGPGPGQLDAAAAQGFDATLDALLSPGQEDAGVALTPPPSFPLTAPGLDESASRTFQLVHTNDEWRQLVAWWLDRMVASEQPLRELMTWFWHGHFATSYRTVDSGHMMLQQNETQRRLALGDFADLARAMVVDPAMLIWLNGTSNHKGHPNENLAREFMELFTLGVGGYAETDVRQAARALTGWRVQYATGTATPVPKDHDPGPETILGASAPFDAGAFASLLADRPDSARFVATRLWRRLVGDAPPDAPTLAALVRAYGPRRDVGALLRAVVTAPAFRDPRSVLVRQPVDWLVAALRALQVPASRIPVASLISGLSGMGQVPFDPPNVGGWPSGPRWLTTASALARWHLAQALAAVGDIAPVTDAAPSGRADAAAELLGLPPFTARTKTALALVSGNPKQVVAVALCSPECSVSA